MRYGWILIVAALLLLLLWFAQPVERGFLPEKCAFDGPFTCEATIDETALWLTLSKNGTRLDDVTLSVQGDCFEQYRIGQWNANESLELQLCASQLLDRPFKALVLVTYEQEGMPKEVEGVIRLA